MHAQKRTVTRNRIMALLAGGIVLGVGATATLASWNDSEWVYAGNGSGGPGVGTSVFEVQQDASNPATGTFADFESNPGDALTFSAGALALSPGQTVYAPVALKTTSTSIAGTMDLKAAVAATGVTATSPAVLDAPGAGLWNALTLQVVVSDSSYTCNLAAMSAQTEVVAAGSALNAAGTATRNLSAAGANTQYYCFAITLPTPGTAGAFDSLQGHVVAPAWQFAATSN